MAIGNKSGGLKAFGKGRGQLRLNRPPVPKTGGCSAQCLVLFPWFFEQDLNKYTNAWSILDPAGLGVLPPRSVKLLWRYIAASHQEFRGSMMHSGLREYCPLSFEDEFRYPVILWPINRRSLFVYWEGIAALISTICDVGYIEHRLLQQLVCGHGGGDGRARGGQEPKGPRSCPLGAEKVQVVRHQNRNPASP